MKKIFLVLVAVVLAGGVTILVRRLAGRARPAPSDSSGQSESTATAPPPAAAPASELGAPTPGPTRAAVAERAALAQTFELESARWLAGRLTRPAGAPAEPALEVVALSVRPGDPEEWGHELGRRGASLLLSPGESELPRAAGGAGEPQWSRRPVAADGSFRVPLHPDAESALLVLRSDWLYLDAPAAVSAQAESVHLEARLGGRVRLRLVPPPGAEPERLAELVGATCQVGGSGGARGFLQRQVALPDTLVLELDALPPDMQLYFGVETLAFVPPVVLGLRVQPGQWTEREVPLQLGAEVSGRVLASGGEPLAEARVSARVETELGFSGRLPDRAALTDADGRFRLRAVPPGQARLDVIEANHLPGNADLGTLSDGEVRSGVEVTLSDGESVGGVVKLPDGSPAAGAAVRLRDLGPPDPERTALADSRRIEADPQGRFAIAGLGTGPFALKAVWRPSDGAAPFKAWIEEVPAGSTDLVVALRPTITLAGRVQDERGRPVPSFGVSANRLEVAIEDAEKGDFADPGGAFELAGLVPGTWSLRVAADGHASAQETVQLPLVQPLVVVLERTGTVRGLVLDPSGLPVAGARVLAASPGGTRPEAECDADGRFELADLPAGDSVLTAASKSWAPSEEVMVQVGAGEEVDGVVLELRAGGTLTGEVWDDEGRPAPGRTVAIQGAGTRGMGSSNLRTDAEGRFEREHLAPDTYQVVAMPDFTALALTSDQPDVGAVLSQVETATATIVEGQTTHVVLGAPPEHPVTVRGRITAGGQPLAGAFLAVVGEDRPVFDALQMEQADANGAYELELDAPGNYTFLVAESPGDDAGGVEFGVTVPDVSEHRLDLELPSGALRGVVVDAAGRPVEGARIQWSRAGEVSSLSGLAGAHQVQSRARGEFELRALRPGLYVLRVSPPGDSGLGQVVSDAIRVGEDARVEGVRLVLPPGGAISGVVRDAAGQPVRGARVHVRDAAGRVVSSSGNATTDASGEFTAPGLAPGIVTVSAREPVSGQVSGEVGPVDVRAGETAEVEIVLEAGGWLVVSVTDQEGKLLRSSVEVTGPDGRSQSDLLPGEVGLGGAGALSSTERRIGPLPTGRYRVRATTPDGQSAERPVTVRAGREKKVRLEL